MQLRSRQRPLATAVKAAALLALLFGLLSCRSQPDETDNGEGNSEPTAVSTTSSSLPATPSCVALAGGTIIEGIVGAPQYLNPLLSDPYPVDRELNNLIFDGLTRYNDNGQLVGALAESWTVSEDGRTLQFTLRENEVWHDGEPVTAADVVFTYSLMQEDAFPGSPDLKTLWQAVEVRAIDDRTVELVLDEPYSPFLEATTRGILPAHKLEGVTAVQLPNHPFNDSPVGTGPFMVPADQAWRQTHRLQLIPSPSYWTQDVQIDGLEYQFFPDTPTLLAAFAAGDVHAVNGIGHQFLPDLAAIPGARLFTAPAQRYTELLFNVADSAHPALQTVEGRQALAYGLNRQAIVDSALNGQGLLFDGPYLPSSWANNAQLTTIYPYEPATADALLDGLEWKLVEGTAVRQKEEQPLTLRLLTLNTPIAQEIGRQAASQWAEIGVGVAISATNDMGELLELLSARNFDVALLDIAPPHDPDLYDFWSQEAIIRGQNYAGWNNRRASEALENGRKTWPLPEREGSYNTFLRLFNQAFPAYSLYQHTYTYALNQEIENADIGLINQPRDRYRTLPIWSLPSGAESVDCLSE